MLPGDDRHANLNIRMPNLLIEWLREEAFAQRRTVSAHVVFELERLREQCLSARRG